MLFDPKIKLKGKIRNIQLVDPSKIVLKDFNNIKNKYKAGDSLLVTENDSITEAIYKLHESLHPSRFMNHGITVDYDAMSKLYPNNVTYLGKDDYVQISNPFDGMKIIFTNPVNMLKNATNKNKGICRGLLTISYQSTLETYKNWGRVVIDLLEICEVTRTLIVNNFVPVTVGDYEMSEFRHDYLILEKYVTNTNYITIYKTNLEKLEIHLNSGREVF